METILKKVLRICYIYGRAALKLKDITLKVIEKHDSKFYLFIYL